MVLARLCRCVGSPESLLVTAAISTDFICSGPIVHNDIYNKMVFGNLS